MINSKGKKWGIEGGEMINTACHKGNKKDRHPLKDINKCNFYICLIVNWESHKSIAINLIKPPFYWGVLGAKPNFNSMQTSDRFPKDFICFCSVSFLLLIN